MAQKFSWTFPPDRLNSDQDLFVIGCGYDIIDETDIHRKSTTGNRNFHILNVISGSVTVTLKGKEYKATKGDVVFLHIDEQYNYTYHHDPETTVYWIHFFGKKARDVVTEMGLTDSFVSPAGADLKPYFENIINEVIKKKKHYNKGMTGSLLLLLTDIVRSNETIIPELENIITLMKDSKNKELSIEEYAKLCNVSKSQFIRNFKKYTGKTPLKFKNEVYINFACNLLTKTASSITEISTELGFDNIYYFSNIFKKHTGMSPKEYRKLYK